MTQERALHCKVDAHLTIFWKRFSRSIFFSRTCDLFSIRPKVADMFYKFVDEFNALFASRMCA